MESYLDIPFNPSWLETSYVACFLIECEERVIYCDPNSLC